ncbi:ATP-binding cassette domain-containing protein [Flavobacterium sp. NST-5]|uniref:ATP-binding cassette domain-containing protein n=1 Tax=Flavobacterium ichthyis TaxID=2698827 RepID=A0ABW9Z6J1_9FLAO|nr:ABC transporter ATP-binding protein [Flavobacterium ichthyis]NBL64478.1 ATP-binding cassette domain-containing protein [Flavobacterium ichthyis]
MLTLHNISFGYTEKKVIHNISFTADEGKNIAIIGESGCGKSTLLKLIYGLYDLDEGEIFFNDKQILGPKFNLIPGEDYIKYLAQDFDLMPYITVEENVGKFLSNIYPEEKKQRISELLAMVEMNEFAQTKAKYLSGGQMQRVALARVLAVEPKILLLDEPFSHIDNFRKNALRRNLFAYLKRKKITVIVATHDSADALAFADETLVMQNGKLLEYGNSKDIYFNPKNKYTASLFGEVNEISVEDDNGETTNLLLYPHQLKVNASGFIQVRVKQSFFKGNRYLIKSVLDKQVIFFEHNTALENESSVYLEVSNKVL